MYLFKTELKEEVLKGKKIRNIANNIGITEGYLYSIFNGKTKCSKLIAFCLTKILNNENEIEDFFNKEK